MKRITAKHVEVAALFTVLAAVGTLVVLGAPLAFRALVNIIISCI